MNVALLKLGVDPERPGTSIQTSEMTELWGIVVNEAMAAGNQALTSDTSAAMAASFRRAAVLTSSSKPVGPEDM